MHANDENAAVEKIVEVDRNEQIGNVASVGATIVKTPNLVDYVPNNCEVHAVSTVVEN